MDIDDPRLFAAHAESSQTPLFEMAEASLAASSIARADEIDRALVMALARRLIAGC